MAGTGVEQASVRYSVTSTAPVPWYLNSVLHCTHFRWTALTQAGRLHSVIFKLTVCYGLPLSFSSDLLVAYSYCCVCARRTGRISVRGTILTSLYKSCNQRNQMASCSLAVQAYQDADSMPLEHPMVTKRKDDRSFYGETPFQRVHSSEKIVQCPESQ